MHSTALKEEVKKVLNGVDFSDSNASDIEHIGLLYRMQLLVEGMEKLLDEHKIVYNPSKEEAMKKLAKGEEVIIL